MIKAATTPSIAASTHNPPLRDEMQFILFGLWCRAVQAVAPKELSEERKDAFYAARGDEIDRHERKFARLAMQSEVYKCILIWILTLRRCDKIDRANPVLPNACHREERRLVLEIARQHPDLAQLAGVTHAEISGNSPHDGQPLAAT